MVLASERDFCELRRFERLAYKGPPECYFGPGVGMCCFTVLESWRQEKGFRRGKLAPEEEKVMGFPSPYRLWSGP